MEVEATDQNRVSASGDVVAEALHRDRVELVEKYVARADPRRWHDQTEERGKTQMMPRRTRADREDQGAGRDGQ